MLNARKDWADGKELAALLEEWMAAPSLYAVLKTDKWGWVWQALKDNAHPPIFIPSKNGKNGLYRVSPPSSDEILPFGFAFTVSMFGELVTNPLCEKLGGPCARCGDYYIKKTARQNTYCSLRCGRASTAAYATKKRLQDERSRKLAVASDLKQKWITTRTKEDWKQWVSKQPRGKRMEITPKFLTRAVNKGELVPPIKEK